MQDGCLPINFFVPFQIHQQLFKKIVCDGCTFLNLHGGNLTDQRNPVYFSLENQNRFIIAVYPLPKNGYIK